jgi:hypothetical protein
MASLRNSPHREQQQHCIGYITNQQKAKHCSSRLNIFIKIHNKKGSLSCVFLMITERHHESESNANCLVIKSRMSIIRQLHLLNRCHLPCYPARFEKEEEYRDRKKGASYHNSSHPLALSAAGS